MSRTYRRLSGSQWHHNWIVKRWKEEPERGGSSRSWPDMDRRNSMIRELARYHSDNGYSDMGTPSWWINEFMTVPQRQEVRRLVHKVRHLPLEDAGELMFPLAKKPHHYYW